MNIATRGAAVLALFLGTAAVVFHVPVLWVAFALALHLAFYRRAFSGFHSWRTFWTSELGAVIPTTYYARSGIPGGPVLIDGSSTPPTAIQARQIPCLRVRMVMTDGVIQGTITHNWGLDKSAPEYLEPEIWYWCENSTDGAPGATWLPMLTFDLTNTNLVLVNKIVGAAATPTGGTYIITLRRPYEPGQ